LILISDLLRRGEIQDEDIIQGDLLERANKAYVATAPQCALKRMEEDYLYHVGRDELFEINEEALEALQRCDGTVKGEELGLEPDFLVFCLQEGLLEIGQTPEQRPISIASSPIPSLRYLEWLVTLRCNLACAHCYLGLSSVTDYPKDLIDPLLGQFSHMAGLRIMVSGGEPTMYPHFNTLNSALAGYPIRSVLLSNGIAITPSMARNLNFHEVQISLDGMERGNDLIRGKGSFQSVLKAMKAIKDAGLDLSVATMIHSGNIEEFDEMEALFRELGVLEWSIDYPCSEGRWGENPDLLVDGNIAARLMEYGFGGAYHGTASGWTCGRHLGAVLPTGQVCKCGLFQEKTYGSIKDGLLEAWTRVEHIPISDTECANCEQADLCGGGCRFRAGSATAKDIIMCGLYGA
jgi:radical SAM protein with 4Fe4S-binding SPASM domain